MSVIALLYGVPFSGRAQIKEILNFECFVKRSWFAQFINTSTLYIYWLMLSNICAVQPALSKRKTLFCSVGLKPTNPEEDSNFMSYARNVYARHFDSAKPMQRAYASMLGRHFNIVLYTHLWNEREICKTSFPFTFWHNKMRVISPEEFLFISFVWIYNVHSSRRVLGHAGR